MKALSAGGPAKVSPGGATIYQVAQSAAVSIATVSRVLRGTAPVAAPTRERVLRAVDALGYRPNRMGRSLAEGLHAADGIVFPHLSGPYFAEVVLGYEEVAAARGRSVLILATYGRDAAADQVLDLASRVDGLVFLGPTVEDGVLAEIAASRLPLVLIARNEPETGSTTVSTMSTVSTVSTVNTENEDSAHDLTTHLVAVHGYRNLIFLGDADTSLDALGRWRGFRRAMDDAGMAAPHDPVGCVLDEAGGYAAASRLLAPTRSRPQALVCANDEIALGAILAAEELGLRVPADLAITGWDDVMAARHSRPGLTTVRQPMRQIGAQAARRLHDVLSGGTHEPQHAVLPTQLVIRASCGHHKPTEPTEPHQKENR